MFYFAVFFFFKQKTAYEMRISDWSSDVCSSDLPQRPLLAETPVHPAAGRHHSGDVFAKLRVERRPPRDELEAQAIIHHGEPARRQREALTVDPGHIIAGNGWHVGQPGFGGDPGDGAVQFALPHRAEQLAVDPRPALRLDLLVHPGAGPGG